MSARGVLTIEDVRALLRRVTVSNLYRPTAAQRAAHWECESILQHRLISSRTSDRRCVYFLQSGGRRGPVKIGVAGDVARRHASLQSGNPQRLRRLFVIEGAGRAMEQWLHARFSEHRTGGEWFRFAPEIAGFLRTIALIKRLGREPGNRPSTK